VRRLVPAVVLAVLVAGGAALSAGASEQPRVATNRAVADELNPTPTPTVTPTPTPTPPVKPAPVKARTAVTLAVSPARVATGKSVTLSGVAGPVRSGHVVPLKGARLTLQYWLRGATRWTTIRALTAPAGAYRIVWRYPLRSSSTIRAVLAAGTTTRSAVSLSRAVTRVAPLPAPRAYPNCTALHKVYPHGVGLPGAADHTSGTPVRTFTRDAATYRLNTGRDRDKDKIACEKR
jgi:pyruvate/2-oxoglutarate dehydrogenase complex dihydrolipoamide acyltransferase (E2) component